MRRRFIVYIVSAIILVVVLILLLLNIFGIMNPTNKQFMDILDAQLLSYSDNIEQDYDRLAAYAISFSNQLEREIQDYLTENNMSFEDLKDNGEMLSSLQNELYDTVYLNMQLSPSSGAFYILDTTVNSNSSTPLYNGIYLKYVNLYSNSTVNNSITLYRGSYTTGKENGLTFHSGWQNEIKTNFFDNCNSDFANTTHYILSPTVEIPDTWEKSRYVYVPIKDIKKNIIGVCGFEVNNLYFQLTEKSSNTKLGQPIGALLDTDNGSYFGQFDTNKYNTNTLSVSEKNDFTIFDFGNDKCIGKTKNVKLGKDTFTVALMITEAQFNDYINKGQLKTAGVMFLVLLIAIAYCLFISKKYMAPILRKIEQVKSNEALDSQLKIREIDDLFDFLAERDLEHESKLNELETAKKAAEEEALRTREAYEKALEEYELAQSEIVQLSDDKKKEIILEDYEFFICNLKTLTPTEYRVYELYLEGKTATEIASILGITTNTMKYHNRNIYSKLGISSRKQLIQFATLKQHQDKKKNSDNQ
jgi:DNA-binding CsgD family transcriptional regulator